MAVKKGDAVIYIYNKPFESNVKLLKRPRGTVTGFGGALRKSDIVDVDWVMNDGENFHWNVPMNYVKLFKENK